MTIALVFLLLTATLGGYLSIGYLRGTPPPAAGWMLGLVHGVVGAAGLLELVIGLDRHPPPASAGVAGFGVGAEALLGLAILLGLLVIMAAWRGKRLSGVVIGAHASVAITAIVLVSAIVALG